MSDVNKLLEQFKDALTKTPQENPTQGNTQILTEHFINHAPVSECHRKHVNHTDSHIDRIEKPHTSITPTKG